MYIKSITLKDIRGFKDLHFDLQREDGSYAGWTVFTGDNGSGKSTLLKSIVMALAGKDITRALLPSFKGWVRAPALDERKIITALIGGNDKGGVKEVKINLPVPRQAKISLMLVPEKGVDDFKSGKGAVKPFEAAIGMVSDLKATFLETNESGKKTTAERGPWHPGTSGWFACAYGPFRRVFGSSSSASRLMVSEDTNRFVTMFDESASLSEVDVWLKNLSHKQKEGKVDEANQLETLLCVLRQDLLPNGMLVEGVNSDGLWLKDDNGVRLSWYEMSDGYRAALALLTDIIRHLIDRYGLTNLFQERGDGKVFIARSGVVLIDEVDAHLHPEWQRKIGFWLKEYFPNIQFLVTTHSPLVCQAVDSNGLFVLPDPASGEEARPLSKDEILKVISSKSDSILKSAAFGMSNTTSPDMVNKIAEFAKLSAKSRAGARMTAEESSKFEQLKLFVEAGDN
ncbi:AAA family ATPase [Crenobacter sp. SG2305]|uniref:AAA family ATPase n=1 Tax=Crenobacter oryzisoli TaxID=3056844 RepID=UPI0025AB232E|nr:AAA family ATPase [Crenobacter sp. SG2305]MDN0081628.1 AAA family ATPase [Crenobacter sp. SG2305]